MATLGAAQFALGGAVERLRAEREPPDEPRATGFVRCAPGMKISTYTVEQTQYINVAVARTAPAEPQSGSAARVTLVASPRRTDRR